MTKKEKWAIEETFKMLPGTVKGEDCWLAGFEFAKEKLAEKMDEDCYDQECGFSSTDIERFGEEDIE